MFEAIKSNYATHLADPWAMFCLGIIFAMATFAMVYLWQQQRVLTKIRAYLAVRKLDRIDKQVWKALDRLAKQQPRQADWSSDQPWTCIEHGQGKCDTCPPF